MGSSPGLYFSDVINGGVHLLDRTDKVSLAVPKRRGIGGMALHASGGLVVGGRDIIACEPAPIGTTHRCSMRRPPAARLQRPHGRAAGRIYVGSLAFRVFGGETPKPGHLTSSTSTAACARCRTACC